MMDLKLFVVTSIGVLGVSNRSMICITFRCEHISLRHFCLLNLACNEDCNVEKDNFLPVAEVGFVN